MAPAKYHSSSHRRSLTAHIKKVHSGYFCPDTKDHENVAGQDMTFQQGQQFVLQTLPSKPGYFVGAGQPTPPAAVQPVIPQRLVQPDPARPSAAQFGGPASPGNPGQVVENDTRDNNAEQSPNMDDLFGVWDARDPYAIGPRARVSRDDPYW